VSVRPNKGNKLPKKQAKLAPLPEGRVAADAKKKVRAKPRFRPITHALRGMRREQRSTRLSVRNKPITDLIRHMIKDFSFDTMLRPSTVEALQEVVEAGVLKVLRDAFDRRLEAMTETEQKKQTSVQLMAKNVYGAFRVWAEQRQGQFTEFLEEAKDLTRHNM
jgi:histone H3/H4